MNRMRVTIAALLTGAVAGLALAQNADQNTAGPTRNDYRLRVIQPLEGGTIVGNRIQVVVDTEIPAERDTRQDVNSMPRPDIDVFIDNLYQGTMRDAANVVDIENVAPGAHEIVLLAKNRSGEIVDRRVLNVTAIAPRVETVERPVPPPAPKPVYVPPPAPPYEPPAQVPVEELPTTGTTDPLLVVGGLALLLAGIVVRRFA